MLQRICNLIKINKQANNSLDMFDREDGQSQIFQLFPHDVFSRWRKIYSQHGECGPPFTVLLNFIAEQVKNVSSLEYKGTKTPISTTLATSSSADHQAECRQSKSDHEKFCFRHKSKHHELFECKEFCTNRLFTNSYCIYSESSKI